ncbi:hypothetical protein M527_04065 [Sphingobium indicum IP26]|uniref:Uncharacterized protein n=1 Tax=Sphingobium indicum F2 TaxID=1450518 RepID=A0A8E0WVF7_9SPHN|nr:hypothetical protein [Sphingobium indicum]EPR11261.1 hypothetical protein M527_04065 [Sphingobium indicum IP26]KER38041.1 hypothetical protein AL00_01550 [Sphingobium indicum F2]
MLLIAIGALCMIAGVVLATLRTLRRGRLSQARSVDADEVPDTLEPARRGSRLGMITAMPGIGLALIGAGLMFAGASL